MKVPVSPSDLIASLALLVAIVAAFYARASARAAVANNRIGLHQPRHDIYTALLHFRSLFVGMDVHPTDEEIDAFYVKAVAPAQIYLDADSAKRIHGIYKQAQALFLRIDLAESEARSTESKWVPIEQFQHLGRTELEDAIRLVGARIRVGDA